MKHMICVLAAILVILVVLCACTKDRTEDGEEQCSAKDFTSESVPDQSGASGDTGDASDTTPEKETKKGNNIGVLPLE